MKALLFLPLLFFSFIRAQNVKISIVDSEDKKVISGARIIADNHVYYSNEDGVALLPSSTKLLRVTAFGYENKDHASTQPTIEMKPLYRKIDEVKLVSIDFEKFIQRALKNYDKVYYTKPAIYDISYRQSSSENAHLKSLLIADGKFWSRDGTYNSKENFKREENKFVQFQYDYLRYKIVEPSTNKIKIKKQDLSQDYLGNLFLNYELNRLHRYSKIKNAKVSARIVFEDAENQEIFYSIKMQNNAVYSGTIVLNKKDQAITYLHLDYIQDKLKPYQLEDENGVKYEHQLGNGQTRYEFYKSGDYYVPSKVAQTNTGSKFSYENQVFEYSILREIVFKNFKEGTLNGLEKPVNLYSPFWDSIPFNEQNEMVNLSREEQDFINEHQYEN